MSRVRFRTQTTRQLFPGFAAMLATAAGLLKSNLIVLVAAFLFLLIVPVAGAFGTRLSNWRSQWFFDAWTLNSIGLVAAWSTLGSGRWHFRFPLACIASLWILSAHLLALNYFYFGYDVDRFFAACIATFILSGFGAMWIRSIGGVEFHRRPEPGVGAPLRRGQFRMADVMSLTLIIAILLGLMQAPNLLWSELHDSVYFLYQDKRVWPRAGVASALVLAAFLSQRYVWLALNVLVAWGLLQAVDTSFWRNWIYYWPSFNRDDYCIRQFLDTGLWSFAFAGIVLGAFWICGYRLARPSATDGQSALNRLTTPT